MCLTVNRTFQSWTLENVVEAIKQNTEKQCIDDVSDRYLNFGKIDSMIEFGAE
jgi:hypothetical protein